MRIGKDKKRVKSPQRRVRKAGETPKAIPVEIPKKEPERVGAE